MSLNGTEDMEPMRVGISITDTIAGLYAAFGVLVALREKERIGHGYEIQSAMVDCLISMFTFASGAFFATSKLPPRNGNDHMVVSPYGLYQASDGPIAIAPSTEKTWLSLCKVLDLENLIMDSRFDTNEKRRDNRPEINKILGNRIRTRSRAEWIELLNKEGVPCGPIYNLREAFSDLQVLHQEMVLESSQPSGKIKIPGFPLKIYGAPAKLHRPSPQVGEHTIEMLKELGYSDEEIIRIQKANIA